MKLDDLPLTIVLIVVTFFLLAMVAIFGFAAITDIPTQDARAAPTISIPDAPQ